MHSLDEYFPTNFGTNEKPNHGFSIVEYKPKKKAIARRAKKQLPQRWINSLTEEQLAEWKADMDYYEIERNSQMDYKREFNYDGGEETPLSYLPQKEIHFVSGNRNYVTKVKSTNWKV